MNKLLLSGHETFHCRHFWLKKGYDFIQQGNKFNDSTAVVELGVGKNMVRSIKYWLQAFNLLDEKNNLTPFAHFLFDNNGKDPFIEDPATIWLLHYLLIFYNKGSFYSIIFNEFQKEKIEFTKTQLFEFINNKCEESNNPVSKNSISNGINVFLKGYLKPMRVKNIEDDFSGLLMELDLIRPLNKNIENDEKWYKINTGDRHEIPIEIILFSIINNPKYAQSISFNSLMNDFNSVGNIYGINANGLVEKINEMVKKYPNIIFTDYAGIKELQFKTKLDKWKILTKYYEN